MKFSVKSNLRHMIKKLTQVLSKVILISKRRFITNTIREREVQMDGWTDGMLEKRRER